MKSAPKGERKMSETRERERGAAASERHRSRDPRTQADRIDRASSPDSRLSLSPRHRKCHPDKRSSLSFPLLLLQRICCERTEDRKPVFTSFTFLSKVSASIPREERSSRREAFAFARSERQSDVRFRMTGSQARDAGIDSGKQVHSDTG